MAANGRQWLDDYKKTISECDRSVDHLRAEIARLEEQLAATVEHQEKIAAAAVVAGAPEDLRRSAMTAKDISNFIRNYPGGPQAAMIAFRELPK